MVYNIIPFVIIVLSLAGIIVIIIRKFPELAIIDVNSIPEEKQKEIKKKIIAQKAKRELTDWLKKIILIFRPLGQKIRHKFGEIHSKAKELERAYEKKEGLLNESEKEELNQKILVLLSKAEELFKKGDLAEAEENYINIISLDSKNIEAYRGLGDVYFEQKDYDHAKEIFKHVLKLSQEKDEIYFNLGLVNKAKGEDKEALEYFKKAVELKPNSPRYLDMQMEMSLVLENKTLARKSYQALKKANPENQKLEEFKEKINKM